MISKSSTKILIMGLALAGVVFAYLLGVVTAERAAFIRGAAASMRDAIRPPEPASNTRSIVTGLLRLRLEEVETPLSRPGGGGALTSVGDEMLLLGHDGAVLAVSGTSTRPTRITVPDNGYDAYVVAAGAEKYADLWHDFETIRYNDILYYHDDDAAGLVVSYTEWLDEPECYVTTVAHRVLPPGARSIAAIEDSSSGWDVVHRTEPCLPLKEISRALEGQVAGGRMVYHAPGKILLGSGDYHWDGVFAPIAYAQVEDADYGKILEIDLERRTARHFSTGHRNVQGITLDHAGRVWAVEHGPRGGDELNLIVEGGNYGWPETTLGTQYTVLPWPLAAAYGRHVDFDPPVYAWMPSVGVSNLMQIDGFDPSWDGDLLVASLVAGMLYRLRMEEDRVLLAEPIRIGERIRYAHQHTDGRIVLWTDSQRLIFMSKDGTLTDRFFDVVIDRMELDAVRRDRLNNAIEDCAQCHSFEIEDGGASAPSLGLVFERPIAAGDFAFYSAALRARAGLWTEENLTRYLQNPGAFAPGTTMPSPNLPREAIDDLVSLLRALRLPRVD